MSPRGSLFREERGSGRRQEEGPLLRVNTIGTLTTEKQLNTEDHYMNDEIYN
jgi:hypothetical protein